MSKSGSPNCQDDFGNDLEKISKEKNRHSVVVPDLFLIRGISKMVKYGGIYTILMLIKRKQEKL